MSKYQFSEIAEFISEKILLKDLQLSNYISTDNMIANLGGVVPAEKLPTGDRCNHFKQGDILFSNIRTYFKKVWLAEFDGGCSADVLIVRSKDEDIVLNGYLYLVMCSDHFIDFTNSSSKGSKMPRGDKNAILKYEIELPSIEKQKEYIKIYLDFNKKIQLNTQINQTLEQIAQTIFKSWFIDFDPVHAKANALANGATAEQATLAAMQTISGKTTAQLTTYQTQHPEAYQQLHHLAQTFPCEFEEIDGVEVPKGWGIKTLKECCENIKNGGTPKRSNAEYWENGSISWLSSGEVCNNKILVSSKEFITKIGLENSSAKLVKENSTLVALYASPTAGKCSFCAFETTTNQAVCSLQPKPNFEYFNYYSIQQKEEYFANRAVGSAQQNISKFIVEETPILVPNDLTLVLFNEWIKPLMEYQICNLKENIRLSETRDLLLPKLLSGEINYAQ